MRTMLGAAAAALIAVAGGLQDPDSVKAQNGDAAAAPRAPKEARDVKAEAEAFLKDYQAKLAELDIRTNLAWWAAATTGKQEAFDDYAAASLALREYHSDPAAYARVRELLKDAAALDPIDARALAVAERAYRGNQLPADLLKRMVDLSTEIEETFKTFRGQLDGQRLSNNDLLDMLRKENDSARRQKAWESLKQVGGAVGPKLVALAKVRNEAARKLGFKNYWDMEIRLQEHDPGQLLAIFDELDRLTREPFSKAKAAMDRDLAGRFGVKPEALMPWHYDNPFFQTPPPSAEVDLNVFYEQKPREEIARIAEKFYAGLGLPAEEIVGRSDLYEREGKDQHGFSQSIDRAGDVRILCNVKPTAEWMDTTLHELGHALYDLHIDRRLPYNLREPAHAFTTEGVAMLFGALAKTPSWIVAYTGADAEQAGKLAAAIREQRRREQLVFARWTLVMLHFEKALYEDPDQDLNTLWWDLVERYQKLHRPRGRNEPDWAAKPHFTIAPVYYHNYMLGELFAAQLRHVLAGLPGHERPTAELSFNGRADIGRFLKEKVFKPGDTWAWPEFVRRATGEPLTARYFAEELR